MEKKRKEITFDGTNFKECKEFLGSKNYENKVNYPNLKTGDKIEIVKTGDTLVRYKDKDTGNETFHISRPLTPMKKTIIKKEKVTSFQFSKSDPNVVSAFKTVIYFENYIQIDYSLGGSVKISYDEFAELIQAILDNCPEDRKIGLGLPKIEH